MTACCAAKKATKAGQTSLDGHISIIPGCHAFSQEGVLQAMAGFVICADQVHQTICSDAKCY